MATRQKARKAKAEPGGTIRQADMKCSITGCMQHAVCKGLCDRHYQKRLRARRTVRERVEREREARQKAKAEAAGTLKVGDHVKMAVDCATGKPTGKVTPCPADDPQELGFVVPEPEAGRVSPAQGIEQAEKRNRKIADARIAVCTEFATAMGIKRIELNGGFLFSQDGRKVFLGPGGKLRTVKLRMEMVS